MLIMHNDPKEDTGDILEIWRDVIVRIAAKNSESVAEMVRKERE